MATWVVAVMWKMVLLLAILMVAWAIVSEYLRGRMDAEAVRRDAERVEDLRAALRDAIDALEVAKSGIDDRAWMHALACSDAVARARVSLADSWKPVRS